MYNAYDYVKMGISVNTYYMHYTSLLSCLNVSSFDISFPPFPMDWLYHTLVTDDIANMSNFLEEPDLLLQ